MTLFKGTGAQILVECLEIHGVTRISSVAGESYLAVLDALLDKSSIEIITCRQEGGASYMAESWGKLTGKPGICFVTRGPGACNASIGIHTAMQDSTPMLLFIGQVRREEKEREAFQEIDIRKVFGGLAKWATEIDDPKRIPEIIYRAFKTATSGRPGPVVIGLPEDMLTEVAEVSLTGKYKTISPAISQDELKALEELLKQAQKPLAIVGGPGWTDEDCANFMQFATSCHLPVVTSLRRQDIFDHRNNCYVGNLGFGPNPALIEKIQESDFLLVAGSRLGEIVTKNYTLFDLPKPKQTLVHVHPADSEIGKAYEPTLAIQANVRSLSAALASKGLRIDGRIWSDWKSTLRNIYETWTNIDRNNQSSWDGANITVIFDHLRNNLTEDAVITVDAGNFSGWARRYLQYGRPGRLLAPTNGSMGYAVPAAVGASIAAPERSAVALCGDGGFMMTGQELATAMHHKAKPVIMIFNNGIYGTIRMHQERDYPGRISATTLTNPDFTMLAQSYGAFTARVENEKDFPAIWEEARQSNQLAVIEIKMDPRQITTHAKL